MEYDLKALGRRIFTARKNKNLRQGDVCRMMGMDQSSYSKIEHGKKRPYIDDIFKLSLILGVSFTWLTGGNDIISDLTDTERLEVEKFIRYIKSIRNE